MGDSAGLFILSSPLVCNVSIQINVIIVLSRSKYIYLKLSSTMIIFNKLVYLNSVISLK